jgi:hypothetical protein
MSLAQFTWADAVGGPKRPVEAAEVSEAARIGDRRDAPVGLPGVEEVVPSALQALAPQVEGDRLLLTFEEFMQVPDRDVRRCSDLGLAQVGVLVEMPSFGKIR